MSTPLVSLAELLQRMYPSHPPTKLDKTIVTGRSRGVRALPRGLQPPIYDTPADAPWKVRVRDWHFDQRQRDRRQWAVFFLAIDGLGR